MTKLSELADIEKPQSILVYGPPKSGKTHLVSQLVKMGYKLLWLDLENGYQTLKTSVPRELMDNVELIRIPDTLANPVAIETVTRVFRSAAPIKICDRHGKAMCVICKAGVDKFVEVNIQSLTPEWVVVVDSLSQLSDSAMAHTLGPTKELGFAKPSYEEYAKQGLLLSNILSAQQQAPCHRVFISHEEAIEQEDGSEKIIPVGGTRNFSRKIARYFDHVVYCQTRNKAHEAASSTTYNAKIMSGSRSGISLEDKKAHIADLLKMAPPAPATTA